MTSRNQCIVSAFALIFFIDSKFQCEILSPFYGVSSLNQPASHPSTVIVISVCACVWVCLWSFLCPFPWVYPLNILTELLIGIKWILSVWSLVSTTKSISECLHKKQMVKQYDWQPVRLVQNSIYQRYIQPITVSGFF